MLKRIGSTARQSIETMSGIKVFLELRVKVSKDWRDNPAVLKALGFAKKG
jgi:GTP-binding protein Era